MRGNFNSLFKDIKNDGLNHLTKFDLNKMDNGEIDTEASNLIERFEKFIEGNTKMFGRKS